MIKRHKEEGEPTAAEVMEAAGYINKLGNWTRSTDGKRLGLDLVNRIWEKDGPKALELTAKGPS